MYLAALGEVWTVLFNQAGQMGFESVHHHILPRTDTRRLLSRHGVLARALQ